MRPLRIEFEAFGAYPGPVDVDLASLSPRGLFVVAGDTGTGKTTLLDAMTYALYGAMPLKESGEIRSHHADPDTRTSVRLTFRIRDETWVVERSPAQERPPKRGAGRPVRDGPKVLIQRITEDGTSDAITSVTGVRDKVEELVGLSASQFQRVVLLPQGQVTDFLLAGSTEREALLEQLFDGRVFDVIVEELKSRTKAAAEAVGSIDEFLRSQLANARRELDQAESELAGREHDDTDSPEHDDTDGPEPEDTEPEDTEPEPDDTASLRERLEAATTALGELAAAAKDATEATRHLTDRHRVAEQAAARFDRARDLRSELTDLRATESDAVRAAELAERSQLARPVVQADQRLRATRSALDVATRHLEEQTGSAVEILRSLDVTDATTDPGAIRRAHDRVAEEHRRRANALAALEAAQSALDGAVATVEQLGAAAVEQARVIERTDARVLELEPALLELAGQVVDPMELAERTSTARAALSLRRRLDEERARELSLSNDHAAKVLEHTEVLTRFITTEAPRLALELRDGDPCPVCGSTEHPAPADTDGDDHVSIEQLDAAARRRDLAEQARVDAAAVVADLRSQLGAAANEDEAGFVAALEQAEHQQGAAERIRADHQRLTDELQRAQGERERAGARAAEIAGESKQAEQQRDVRQQELEGARTAAAGVDAQATRSMEGHLAELAALLEAIDGSDRRRAAEQGAFDAAEVAATEGLTASPFDSIDDATAALLDEDDERARLERRDRVTTRIRELSAALDVLVDQGIPDERPDAAVALLAASEAERHSDALVSRHHRVTAAIDRAGHALDTHAATAADSAGARADLHLLQRTLAVCTGGGVLRTPLTRWVLAQELERVARAANEHLDSMTNGRYELRVRTTTADARTAQGLDLEVFDAETGRARSTRSLSGGEQFQASLALALGLADVVSQGGTGSGRRFEALFIDEGFGALDPDSLDDAIETLQSLHATGRTIGVITHVEAMKERLHVGIQVERRPDGNGSQLTVIP